jgi:Na+/melibiose symporter-like transporter
MAGFHASGAGNTSGALTGLTLLFLAAPAALNLLGVALLIGYPLTSGRHAEIRAALEQDANFKRRHPALDRAGP